MEDMLGKHRGLSAVQLGAPVRIIGVNHEGIKIVMINPVMVEQNGSVSMKETCLSCPDMRVTVERPTDITVEYFDKKLKHHVNSFTLPTARVISHELDHLDGITLYDKRESAI
jgi:peptide deformylase